MSRLLTARFGGPRLKAPSPLLMKLYTGFVETSNDRVKELLAMGAWRRDILSSLLAYVNKPRDDYASEGIVAPAGDAPADRAEEVHGA